MTTYGRTGNKVAPEVHFDPDWFNAHVANHGVRVRLEKTTICPNMIGNVDAQHHVPDCPLCENGFYHYDPVEFWAVFQQNALIKNWLREGIFDPGQALITFPTVLENNVDLYVYYFDRITLLDQKERFYQVINKSHGDMDILRYKALQTMIVIDRSGFRYTEGDQFNIDEFGNIVWVPGKKRPSWNEEEGIGEAFSVTYLFRPVYRILNLMHEGRYSQVLVPGGTTSSRLPQTVLIKKDYYLTKRDLSGMPFKPPVQLQEYSYETEDQSPDI